MFVIHETNITKQKEIEKIMQYPFIKSLFLLYVIGFFLKGKYYYAIITKKMKKKTFFEWNFIHK
jgi:p-aminobenzoyl-glutamate transporter AbgT